MSDQGSMAMRYAAMSLEMAMYSDTVRIEEWSSVVENARPLALDLAKFLGYDCPQMFAAVNSGKVKGADLRRAYAAVVVGKRRA